MSHIVQEIRFNLIRHKDGTSFRVAKDQFEEDLNCSFIIRKNVANCEIYFDSGYLSSQELEKIFDFFREVETRAKQNPATWLSMIVGGLMNGH